MAYRLMLQLIEQGKRQKERLLEMADVYYAAGRMTSEEYEDIISKILNKYSL